MALKIDEILIDKCIQLARTLQQPQESVKPNLFSLRIGPILEYPEAKTFLIRLMDTSFRSSNTRRISRYVYQLLCRNKVSLLIFNRYEKALIMAFLLLGRFIPLVSIPLMLQKIKTVTSPILFFVGTKEFNKQAKKRRRENILLNVNLIGESLIGEEEAAERIQSYCDLLGQEDIDYISIKISAIYSQIKPIAFEITVAVLIKKLARIYDELLLIEKETGKNKFVNLDMEEYRDLEITLETFIQTLALPRFKKLSAGIVLQAYLPDTHKALTKLQNWALDRVANGGSAIKVRLVKGANIEMEKTDASIEEWPLTTYSSKLEVDASYKKMLLKLLQKDKAHALHVGIASHNLFDLAFGVHLVKSEKLENYVDFEMLEGMANETVIELKKQKVRLLLYTPIVKKENYNSAMAYLVRRLDEGTQKGNFLKEGYQLKLDSKNWYLLEKQFTESMQQIPQVNTSPKRKQNRALHISEIQTHFVNTPNTDWILKANRKWIAENLEHWKDPIKLLGNTICIVAELPVKEREKIQLVNWEGISPWLYELADETDYRTVIESDSEWYIYPVEKRALILRKAAVLMEESRGDLIGTALIELGKTITEVDIEISEAIDFANYYAQRALDLTNELQIVTPSQGLHLVLAPWNFPIAIPIGGVLASLAAGKRVILRPSQNAAACSYRIAKTLWEAGVPKSAFAFLPCKKVTLDPFLKSKDTFDAVILTGGTDTAKFLLKRTPRLKLYAETGGKNATIITALGDREQGIKNVIQSAFGNAGQKCSATSLLILEKEIYEDVRFKKLLKDAAKSKGYGSPWDLQTEIGPMSVRINKKLQYVLDHTLEEQWLLKPIKLGDFLLSPGIKWGVTSKDYEYRNELFGPILSVIKVGDLKEAVALVNGLEYGLTSGIESLDSEEVTYWLENIKAGNLYVNRSTTGAVVERQPFGGIKASCFGFGMKAGGLNYILQFLDLAEPILTKKEIKKNYMEVYQTHFSKKIDYAKLRGQNNYNLYKKPKKIYVLLDKNVTESAVFKVKLISCILEVTIGFYALENIPLVRETHILTKWQELAPLINHEIVLRALNYDTLDDDFISYCHTKNIHIFGKNPSNYGRLEFLNYLTEQNQSINYHRYGNLMGIPFTHYQ